ncbi:C-type lectin [Penaeus vannamei]|uniref:C-type lectin n=1 Tax=Penaeus vannamei TaxID=6689 RepID=A0A3R7SPY9_PENVA|nr:C-type lectin [Penaeus vannamei]
MYSATCRLACSCSFTRKCLVIFHVFRDAAEHKRRSVAPWRQRSIAMRPLALLLPFLPLLTGSALTSHDTKQCSLGFHNVYDHCVQFRTQSATWHEMSNECFNVGADMVKLDDANFMYYLIKFIKDNGLDDRYYWVGASDEGHEGVFRWTDGTAVKMGTPFWGYHSNNWQEPDGGTGQNCAVLSRDDHFFLLDGDCESRFSVICEMY